jgi:CheY-like chemotaxis protein
MIPYLMLENVGGYVSLGLVTAGARSHNITCKNYDESITTIRLQSSHDQSSQQHDNYYMQEQINKSKDNKGTKRILLVDDEDDINLTVKLVLEGSGFKVDSFSNPLLALESFNAGLYDLAILDVKMPVMNGFGLYQEVRKLDDKVKICFLSAASDIYYEAFGKEALPNIDEKCIIRVPMENELLIKKIKSIIF